MKTGDKVIIIAGNDDFVKYDKRKIGQTGTIRMLAGKVPIFKRTFDGKEYLIPKDCLEVIK